MTPISPEGLLWLQTQAAEQFYRFIPTEFAVGRLMHGLFSQDAGVALHDRREAGQPAAQISAALAGSVAQAIAQAIEQGRPGAASIRARLVALAASEAGAVTPLLDATADALGESPTDRTPVLLWSAFAARRARLGEEATGTESFLWKKARQWESERLYGFPTPPLCRIRTIRSLDGTEFADCGESSFRNFFNLLLFDPAHQRYDAGRLRRAGLAIHPDLLDFYTRHPRVDRTEAQETHDAWARVLRAVPGLRYLTPAPRPQVEIASGLDNALGALRHLTGTDDLAALVAALTRDRAVPVSVDLSRLTPAEGRLRLTCERVRVEWLFLETHPLFREVFPSEYTRIHWALEKFGWLEVALSQALLDEESALYLFTVLAQVLPLQCADDWITQVFKTSECALRARLACCVATPEEVDAAIGFLVARPEFETNPRVRAVTLRMMQELPTAPEHAHRRARWASYLSR